MKKKKLESQLLINLIHETLRERGETLKTLAIRLDISYIHMTSLMGGARQITGLKLKTQRKIAGFLGISMLEFLMLVGVLRKEDFHPISAGKI